MDSSYRPQSPDLSSYAPQSPDLSALGVPQSPDLSGFSAPGFGDFGQQHHGRFVSTFAGNVHATQLDQSPTSVPPFNLQSQQQAPTQYHMPPAARYIKNEDGDGDDDYMPDAPASRRTRQQPLRPLAANGYSQLDLHAPRPAGPPRVKSENPPDPTLGITLKTSFPVARIKRIMQADEDVGKVAQVTPHVVSRALELFMIKLITASTHQAQGGGASTSGGGSKGPRRIGAIHLKKAVMADDTFDFLHEIVKKVSDTPAKAKKEQGSDSEDAKPAKRKGGKKRKDSGDDF